MSGDWDFGEYPENWPEISKGVKERDKWTCQICGRHSRQVDHLTAHHILSNKLSEDSSPSNLITVCDWCHAQIHNHVSAKSPPPADKTEALRRIQYLKDHPEITSWEFKRKFAQSGQKTAFSFDPILILMIGSLILIPINILVWVITEIILGAVLIHRQTSSRQISSQQHLRTIKRVNIGSSVTIVDRNTGESEDYEIVNPDDVDFSKNKISPVSPVGKALKGHTTGDTVTVKTPNGKRKLLVKRIEK